MSASDVRYYQEVASTAHGAIFHLLNTRDAMLDIISGDVDMPKVVQNEIASHGVAGEPEAVLAYVDVAMKAWLKEVGRSPKYGEHDLAHLDRCLGGRISAAGYLSTR